MSGYQRPNQGNNNQQGYKKPAGGGSMPAKGNFQGGQSKPAQKQAAGGAAEGGKSANKPKLRFALTQMVDGKTQTVKGEDGKTMYVAAAWESKFGGFNVTVEQDIPAGSRLRAYDTDEEYQGQKQ